MVDSENSDNKSAHEPNSFSKMNLTHTFTKTMDRGRSIARRVSEMSFSLLFDDEFDRFDS